MPDKTLGSILSDSFLDEVMRIGDWADWTPVYTGFSVDPTNVTARFITVRETAIVRVHMGMEGVSDSSLFTMTLPVTSDSSGDMYGTLSSYIDKGVEETIPGLVICRGSSNIAELYTSSKQANWKAFGGKSANFMFIVEIPTTP